MKAVSLVLTSLLVCALAMPGMAADGPIASAARAAPSRALVDLDLSSTDSNLNAAHVVNTRPATICVGGKPLLVTSRTRLTAAEMVAVYQVIDSGRQAIQIGVHGNAVGGSVVITSRLARNLGSLVDTSRRNGNRQCLSAYAWRQFDKLGHVFCRFHRPRCQGGKHNSDKHRRIGKVGSLQPSFPRADCQGLPVQGKISV